MKTGHPAAPNSQKPGFPAPATQASLAEEPGFSALGSYDPHL